MEPIRVLLADDQQLLRDGLAAILAAEPDLAVVGSCGSGEEALETARRVRPQVVLLDVRMPGMGGVEAARLLKRQHPDTAVVILTTFDDDAYVVESLRAGAVAYLLKDLPAQELVDAVRLVHRGGALIPPAIAAKVLGELRAPRPDPLTPREREILSLLARGLSNREIAAALFLSEGTVKNHISRLYGKLHLRDRVQAVLYAVEQGLLPRG
ncbi:MAG: response regulator transcription factor [Thermaerobacter sp.]|nr:response regulator transcription factor [Thermaerobacter sp.]